MSNSAGVTVVNSYKNGMIHSERALPGTPLYDLLERIRQGAYQACHEWVDMRGKTSHPVFSYVDGEWRCHHVDERAFSKLSAALAGRGKYTRKTKRDIESGS